MNTIIQAIGFGLVTGSVLSLAAVGFTLQFAVTNVLNLAYAGVMGLAGFVALVANQAGLSIWICLVIGAAFGAAASLILNHAVLRPFIRRGTGLFGMVIVTIAVELVLQNGLQAFVGPNFFSYTDVPRSTPLKLGPMAFSWTQLIIIAISIICMIAISLVLQRTKLGIAMRATANDQDLARSCGIRTRRVVNVAWLISGAMCGMAGVALFINTFSFTPSTADGFLVIIVAAAILGGIGQPYGAMLGSLVLGIVTEVVGAVTAPQYSVVAALFILIAVLLIRPQGILAELATQRELAT